MLINVVRNVDPAIPEAFVTLILHAITGVIHIPAVPLDVAHVVIMVVIPVRLALVGIPITDVCHAGEHVVAYVMAATVE